MSDAGANLDAVGREALDFARGLSSGDSALVGVLRDLEQERSRATQAYHAVLRSLAEALEARDGYTGEHSDDVRKLTSAVAARLALDPRTAGEVEAVALLHDIGKIGVPDQILHKPGPLTPEEWEEMRKHPEFGYQMLAKMPYLHEASLIVLQHQERWDGKGYPGKLTGEAIVIGARIFAIVDTLDAITSDRPYRKGRSLQVAKDEIKRCSGTQFDPELVEAFQRIPDSEWTGIRDQVKQMEADEQHFWEERKLNLKAPKA
jgi:HD-GYP domain-containing protein (c-di-GMP phosphodiesterase class II)